MLLLSTALLLSCGGDQKSTSTSTSASKVTSKNSDSASSDDSAKSSGNRKGKLVYKQYCVICHGADGKLAISGATDLSQSVISLEERISQITNGKGLMTPYKDILSKDQINSVAEYLDELKE